MGQDKSLLTLAGQPLVARAVAKLRQLCAEVSILSNNPALAAFGPLVADLHLDCGPISGIEAALLRTTHEWSLILPVDVPFVPVPFLRHWIERTLATPARLAVFVVDGRPQPTLILIQRSLAPALTDAIANGRYKLFPELAAAAKAFGPDSILETCIETTIGAGALEALYFTNLNTPSDFAAAEQMADLLEKHCD
jgi:molybdopterin-guanine dinucleotide biosynthesis protein A